MSIVIGKEKIITIPCDVDFDKCISLVEQEMASHNSLSKAFTHAATSRSISTSFREDLIKNALAEKELYLY